VISIVIPVFNEQESLPHLHARLRDVLKSLEEEYELIFVNDGSTDQSADVMRRLQVGDANVKVVDLSRNFGHQAAIAAGLDYATGSAVIMMDADLQHPPELIPDLLRKWRDGYEVVYTCRQYTPDAGAAKKIASALFYSLINRLSDTRIPPGAADFRLLDRKVVDHIKGLGERALFLRGLVSWVGYRQAAIPYLAGERLRGHSKYSYLRMTRLAVNGLTSFSSVPLYISAVVGAVVSLLSFLYAAYAVYIRLFTDRAVEGWTSVMTSVLFIGGIQLTILGILGIYLGKIFNEVKARPRYLVKRAIGFDKD